MKALIVLFILSNSALASKLMYKAQIQKRLPDGHIEQTEKLLTTNQEIDYALRFTQGLAAPKKNEKITKLYRCINESCETVKGKYIGRAPF